MSALTYDQIHPVDPILTEIMAGVAPKRGDLIANLALPPVDVDPKNFAGKIEVETSRPFMGQGQAVNLERGDLDQYAELSTAKPTYVDYRCVELAAKRTLAKKKLSRAMNPEKLKRREAAIVANAILLEQEQRVANLLFGASNWGANTSTLTALTGGSGEKFGTADAKEISDLIIARNKARESAHGRAPETLLLGVSAFEKLRVASEIRAYAAVNKDRMSLTDDELVSALRNALGVKNVLVGRAMAETAVPGAASSEAYIWGPHALFYWGTPNAEELAEGLTSAPVSAVAIRERLEGGAAGFGAYELNVDDPPAIKLVGAMSRTQVMLPEYDTTGETPVKLAPRGFLVRDCV